MKKIYTIGYWGIPNAEILRAMDKLHIPVVYDIRSKPYSRSRDKCRPQMEAFFGKRYEWHGHWLGGLDKEPSPEGLSFLMEQRKKQNLLCMCSCKLPIDCHRHFEVAMRLLLRRIDVYHLFPVDLTAHTWEIILARELEMSYQDDRDYLCTEVQL